MSIPLVINGATFEYPENFDENWGIDATGWAQAVTNGMLQRAGGNFPLLADVNFGSTFGLIAHYFTSSATHPATSGTLRLGSVDPGIGFRNALNTGNLILTTDVTDNLTYPNGLQLGGPLLLQNESSVNFRDFGSVHTIAMSAPATATNYNFTIPPNTGSAGQVLSTDGSGTTTWVNASGGGTINSGTSGQVAYYATSGTTLSGAPFLSYTAPILLYSAISGNAEFKLLSGGLSNAITSDTSGNLLLQDIDNSRTFLEYLRSGPALVVSVPLSMGTNSITNLANGIAPQDATAFGQVQYAFQNAEYLQIVASSSNSSTTFASTGINLSFTPMSSANRVKIVITGTFSTPNGSTIGTVTVFRGSTNLAGGSSTAGFAVAKSTAAGIFDFPVSITVIDVPATTSTLSYTIQIRSNGSGTVTWGADASYTTFLIEELR